MYDYSKLERAMVYKTENGHFVDGYGVRYENLSPTELNKFCSTLESMMDGDAKNMAALVEDCMKQGRVELSVFPLMGKDKTVLLVEAIDKEKRS